MNTNELTLAKTHDHSAVKNPRLAVVLIHGIASDSTTFQKTLDYLEGFEEFHEVRFVTFDLLGSGKSNCSDELNYGFKDQLDALHNSIEQLNLGNTPLVLIGHSMGSLIATRYTNKYKDAVTKLILISPPMYTERDLDNPAFMAGMKMFQDAISIKNRSILQKKSFQNSISKIVMNRKNFSHLMSLKVPTVLIYGSLDQFIGAHNIPYVLKNNPEILSAIRTEGRHGMSRDKYVKIPKLLEEALNAEII